MTKEFFVYLAAMAIVTYLIRMVPFTAMRSKIRWPYVQSFLFYVPYSVLGAMTFPYIFYATGNMITSAMGTVVAFVLAYFNRSLLTVAIWASVTAFVVGLVFGA